MNLKELRKESGIKAYIIAEKLDISRVQFNNIEKGKSKLDMLKIEKLSDIYGKSVDEIEKAYEVTRDERRRKNI
ncbi:MULTISPECIES: helix-turn-helix transcriptional regulator [Clostridium]|uniref:helix-turn-helix domain-containing protein n=1 Tax=Clostridium TaxID=1485 RepID=UPI001968522B|nr:MULTISPECIES: helix-turn-helix transcriptional regulator [Clostridium]MBN1062696.1 XRE family transcriptional regulator [Clostridium botulinum]